ncbi:MAG: hypothetical protein EBS53_17615 [Bacteroidetes bacterium]|nr:hypothetical protein [Bacteroidota bacterium]
MANKRVEIIAPSMYNKRTRTHNVRGETIYRYVSKVVLDSVDEYIGNSIKEYKNPKDTDLLDHIRVVIPKVLRSLQVGQVLDMYEEYWPYIEKHDGKNLISKVNSWLIDQIELELAKRYA